MNREHGNVVILLMTGQHPVNEEVDLLHTGPSE